jgi:hypothetical protein
MSISTFAELKTAVADWLLRADLTATIPTFVMLAEARMNRDPRLRTIDAVTRGTLSVTGQFTSLPSDFGRAINIELQTEPVVPLEYRSPQALDYVRSITPTGDPRFYSIIGDELEVAPVPSSATLGVIYYRKIPSLSDAAPTNWLLTSAPDLYLYATLCESAPYLKNDDRVGVWEGIYNARCDAYRDQSELDTAAGSPLVMNSTTIG